MGNHFEKDSIYSGIELQYVEPLVEKNFNAVAPPPNAQYQRAVPYGSEMITAAGTRFVVSDKRSVNPCGVGTTHNTL
eukprot:507943-Karenia_brevis.AAC.1